MRFLLLALFISSTAFAQEPAVISKLAPQAELASPPQKPIEAPEQNKIPKELQDVTIVEKLGSQVSIQDLNFRDEAGQPVKLDTYFKKGKPVILSLGYYGCPMLCGMVLNGVIESFKKLDWTTGKEFEFVYVSIDPTEKPELAADKKKNYLEAFNRPGAEAGWHFLTGEESQIKRLASEVGFGYRYDKTEKQYAHGAAIFALTPEGKISRILYGINFSQQDLKLALLEASNGKIGNVIERFLLFCYRYDPMTRKYSLYLTKVMQAGSAGTVLLFGGYLAVFWRRQRRREKEDGDTKGAN